MMFTLCSHVMISSIITTTTSLCHTTRPKRSQETEGEDYHFVDMETMETMVAKGDFLQTVRLYGHLYGLTSGSLNQVATTKKVAVVAMELEGVFALQKTWLKPYVVYLRGKTPAGEYETAGKRGLFNITIDNRDREEAYTSLRNDVVSAVAAERAQCYSEETKMFK
eukprot:m.59325 g.59325  ORF g.59325 m.59325 type:complete len:166 (+) comp19095_c0_seq3:1203-1700(+)